MHDIAELVSLFLTWPIIIFGLVVLAHWYKPALRSLFTTSEKRSAHDWFIMGVAIGFLGGVLDNAYWGLAWTAAHLEWDLADTLFKYGVYPNIPFRQGAGIISGYCHVRAYYITRDKTEIATKSALKLPLIASIILGLLYALLLTCSSLFYYAPTAVQDQQKVEQADPLLLNQ